MGAAHMVSVEIDTWELRQLAGSSGMLAFNGDVDCGGSFFLRRATNKTLEATRPHRSRYD